MSGQGTKKRQRQTTKREEKGGEERREKQADKRRHENRGKRKHARTRRGIKREKHMSKPAQSGGDHRTRAGKQQEKNNRKGVREKNERTKMQDKALNSKEKEEHTEAPNRHRMRGLCVRECEKQGASKGGNPACKKTQKRMHTRAHTSR